MHIINDGNRTESSPIWSVIIRVIIKIGRPRGGRESDLSITNMIKTELDDKKSCNQLIITVKISENNKYIQNKNVQQRHYLKWKIPQFQKFHIFFPLRGYCYGYYDQFYDWWIWLKELSMIACFNCPITRFTMVSSISMRRLQ